MLSVEFTVNAFYGFDNVEDEQAKFVKSMTTEGLEKVLIDLCVKGTTWSKSMDERYTIDRASLNLECQVWINFLKTCLMPIAHNTIVGEENFLLLHSIMKGRKINTGVTICDEIHKCAQKNSRSLIFPSFI